MVAQTGPWKPDKEAGEASTSPVITPSHLGLLGDPRTRALLLQSVSLAAVDGVADLTTLGHKPQTLPQTIKDQTPPDHKDQPLLLANANPLCKESTWSRNGHSFHLVSVPRSQVGWEAFLCHHSVLQTTPSAGIATPTFWTKALRCRENAGCV